MGVTGIILAGGKSSRMGTDKALLTLNGKSFLEYCSEIVQPLCNEIIISSSNIKHQLPETKRVEDIYTEKGPLGGLHASLLVSTNDIHICLSVDTPFIQTAFFQWLLDQQKGTNSFFIKESGRYHPLIGVFHKNALVTIENALKNNQLRSSEVIESIEHNWQHAEIYPDYHFEMFTNINTQEEYNKALKK